MDSDPSSAPAYWVELNSLRAQLFEEPHTGERTRERERDQREKRGAKGLSFFPQGGIVCSSSPNPPPYIGGRVVACRNPREGAARPMGGDLLGH
jgi:hypothetical protein